MFSKNEYHADEWIVEQVLQGEAHLYKEIISRYQNLLYSIGMRFFRNSQESEDFVQDVMIKTYENLKSYRGKAPFRVWLTRIAYNYGIDKVRAIKEEEELQEHTIPSVTPSPEEHHMRSEVREVIVNAIDTLPERYRVCLDFFFFWGLTYSEISEITGFPVNTIKSHVLRAKQSLRTYLKGTVAERYYEM